VGLLIAGYMAAVVVDDLPPSPARQVLIPLADHVVDPWFAQQWTLFAPTPPTANAQLYLTVRYRPQASGAVCRPIDLSAVYLAMAKTRRWAPSRLYRVTMTMAVLIDQLVEARLARVGHGGTTTAEATASQAEANVYLAPSALGTEPLLTRQAGTSLRLAVDAELQRLLSASARALCPRPRSIAAVEGTETTQAIPPYSHPHRSEPVVDVFSTGWMAYRAGVAA
jgi:hypothetical protein